MTVEDYEDMLLLDNTTSARPEALLVPGKNCPGTHTVDHRLTLDFTQVKSLLSVPLDELLGIELLSCPGQNLGSASYISLYRSILDTSQNCQGKLHRVY